MRAIKRNSLFRSELLADRAAGIHIRATARRNRTIASYIGETATDGRAIASDIREIRICSREIAADSPVIGVNGSEIVARSQEIAADVQAMPANTRATGIYHRRTVMGSRGISANTPLPMI